jgi:hypothetical protein
MTQIDQDLLAALYALGFDFLGGDLNGEIAEIKGDDYQAGASAWRRVEIRRHVAGWAENDLQCRPPSNR